MIHVNSAFLAPILWQKHILATQYKCLYLKETNMDFTKAVDPELLRSLLVNYCYHIVCFLDWVLTMVLLTTFIIKWSINCIVFSIFKLHNVMRFFTQRHGALFYSTITFGVIIFDGIVYSHLIF